MGLDIRISDKRFPSEDAIKLSVWPFKEVPLSIPCNVTLHKVRYKHNQGGF